MHGFTRKQIDRAAAGDQGAIAELYEQTYSSVYKAVRAMVADEDAALDIVQDSYIKGFQSLEQLDSPENFRAWMKRIATNKAKDHLKKKKPMLFTDMAGDDGSEPDFQDDCLTHCPEEVMDQKETARLMQEILDTLSEDQRMVIGMYYYEELSVREIAALLDCSENTVKSRLNYGRKKIEAKVKELEKKGTKLYSLAPLPFLLWLFRTDAQAAAIPSPSVLKAVTAQCAAGSAATVGTAVGAKTAAAAASKALGVKIVSGALAVGLLGGAGAVIHNQTRPDPPEPHYVSAFSELSSEHLDQLVRQVQDRCEETFESGHTIDIRDGIHDFTFRQEDVVFSEPIVGGAGYFLSAADQTVYGENLLLIPVSISVSDAPYLEADGWHTAAFSNAVAAYIFTDLYLMENGDLTFRDYVDNTVFYATAELLENNHVDPLCDTFGYHAESAEIDPEKF